MKIPLLKSRGPNYHSLSKTNSKTTQKLFDLSFSKRKALPFPA